MIFCDVCYACSYVAALDQYIVVGIQLKGVVICTQIILALNIGI